MITTTSGPALEDRPATQPFDPRSGSPIERLIFNHRIAFVLLCLLATVLFASQLRGLRLNASFERMLPTGHPFIQNYQAHRADLSGLGNTLRIAVVPARGGSILEAAYLDQLKRLNDELFLMPGVDRPFMRSLWTPATRWMGVTEEGLDGGPVIPDTYDGSPDSLDQLRRNIDRSGELGTLVAADYSSTIVLVPLMEGARDENNRIDYRDLSERIESLRAKYEREGLQIHIVGFAKIVGDLLAGLQQMLLYFALAIAICTGALFLYTRCVRSTLLVVTCSLVAVVWLLGALPLIHIELDPYSVLVPFLVFAIGMSHGAQKMNGIMQDIARGMDRWVAARMTFRRLFLAGLTALLADVVGFAVLMVIDIPVIQDLALSASLGVGTLVFTNLVLLPVLLSFTGVSAAAARRGLTMEAASVDAQGAHRQPVWDFLDRFTRRRGALMVLGAAGLIAVAAFAVSLHLKVGDLDPGAPELRPDSRYNRDNAYVTAHYAASSDVFVVMVTTGQYLCSRYDTLAQVDALEWRLQQLPGVESTQSYASLGKRMAAGMNEGSAKWYELPRTQDMLNAITARAPRGLFNQNCDLLTVYVNLVDHRADTLAGVVKAVDDFARANNTDEVKFLSAAGNAGIEAATNIVVARANRTMLLLVYLAVTVLAFVTFRSWRAVLCAILPLALTSILCEAVMVACGIGVKVATLPVIALGVGIGVDYALYVLSVMLAGLRRGLDLSQAYRQALQFTGRVVVLTGVTLAVAVATWTFSAIKFQADMGLLLAFMFIVNMVGALVLLPALATFLLQPARRA